MSPDDPRHGTNAGYVAGCHGEACREARRNYMTQRETNPMVRARDARLERIHKQKMSAAAALGQEVGHADAAPVVAHVRALLALGWSTEALAAMHGNITREGVRHIANRPRTHTKRESVKLLQIPYSGYVPAAVPDTAFVPIIGYNRRRESLLALGHTNADIAAVMGVIRIACNDDRIMARRWRNIDDAYRRLCMTPGRSNSTRLRAKRLGYVVPLGWNDIDDPTEKPTGLHTASGHNTDINATRAHELEHLAFMGETLDTVATRLGVDRDTLNKWCARHGHLDLYHRLANLTDRRHENQHTNPRSVA